VSLTPFEIQQLADAIAERLSSRATGDVYLEQCFDWYSV
jgi:hypothetical protein